MAGEAKVVVVPVVEVTLLEDRAHVVRRGRVEVAAGPGRLTVDGVAPVLSDKTLVVKLGGAEDGAARVIDARVRRRIVRAPLDGEEGDGWSDSGALTRDRARLAAELELQRDQSQLLARRARGLDQIAGQSLAELAVDVAWNRSPDDGWADRLDGVESAERELVEEMGRLERVLAERTADLERLDHRIAALDHRAEHEAASVDIELTAVAAGPIELQLDYVVPGACWRPQHSARLSDRDGDASVTFATDACVWQNTGEDWRDVVLLLSTERVSLGVEPPELDSDVLAWRKKSEAIVVETRDQEIDTVGLGAARPAGRPELPGIDDGGVAQTLRAPGRATVLGDGTPYRVRLSEQRSAASCELVAFPELAACAVLRTTLDNPSDAPILAGPVDLIRDSGLVGRTKVLFVAPGEKFQLGWGPEADIRIKRKVEEQREKSRMLSSWVERRHQVEVRLSNLGQRARRLVVTERVPVSEIDKVKIEVDPDKTTGQTRPDADGMVRWTVDLAGSGHDTLKLHYLVRKHEDVVGL